jgi:hypothetical protein
MNVAATKRPQSPLSGAAAPLLPAPSRAFQKESAGVQSEMQHNGRLQMARIVALDAVVLSYVALTLALSDFDGYDMFFLAFHLPHIFTVMLAYGVVTYSSKAVEVLRILVAFYLIELLIDCAAFGLRFIFMVHSDRVHWVGQLVRMFIALLFVCIDLFGFFFAEMMRETAYSFVLGTDRYVAAFAEQRMRKMAAQKQPLADNLV